MGWADHNPEAYEDAVRGVPLHQHAAALRGAMPSPTDVPTASGPVDATDVCRACRGVGWTMDDPGGPLSDLPPLLPAHTCKACGGTGSRA